MEELLMKKAIAEYNSITIYGTGDGAHIVYHSLIRLGLLDRIKHVIDKDDSVNIGKQFESFKVSRINEIIYDTDMIIIGAKIHRAEIKARLDSYLLDNKLNIAVLDFFDPRFNDTGTNSIEDCMQYLRYIETKITKQNPDFVPIAEKPYIRDEKDSKIIAWFLPQFYQMEVNNKYHGQGFTEWTNVTQALPLFTGHYQPHIPYDVGFYDLTNIDTLKRQVQLAKMYGIYGFCFHYYWFSGARTMEKPIEKFLEHKEIDMPFFLNWATENWTSKWDGGNHDIIFEQKLEQEDDRKFMEDIIPYMKDERYVKINGKPVLSVYCCTMFEKERFKKLLSNFRRYAKKEGFRDLYILISTYRYFFEDVTEWGADALVEFPPTHIARFCELISFEGYKNPYFKGFIYDYQKFVKERKYLLKYKSRHVFRSALVSFDNTARSTSYGGIVFSGANPETYKMWLKDILEENKTTHNSDDNFIFVNSWNEWAEGSHLEPDMKYGYGYLNATKEALIEVRNVSEA